MNEQELREIHAREPLKADEIKLRTVYHKIAFLRMAISADEDGPLTLSYEERTGCEEICHDILKLLMEVIDDIDELDSNYAAGGHVKSLESA
jgi:hypothetical protein